MSKELPKAYEPGEIEKTWAQEWFKRKLFCVEAGGPGPVFSIAIPPPNVTGSIHIGHMLEHTQIDVLVRWHRMRGFRTLWLPGTDHAGIATQVVVERKLAEQGLKREQIGREEFERRVWEWKAESGDTIKQQMIRLGDSVDWSRERFTLDPPLYRAVMEAFLRLYREGLIYRGRYMVNWCPRCMTALSDLETIHQEQQGQLWHIRYPVVGSNEFVVVATTRPETMLGDSAVAVHPEDERYTHLVGKKVLLPLMNREIPIIADAYVDREFGSGCLKITPAHDPNDFEVGKRHHLPEVDVLRDDAHMSAAAGPFAGLDRYAARKRIVADLQAQGLLEKTVAHTHAVGTCDRCKTQVEPRISMQWFCKMQPLAAPALKAVEDGLIPIVPESEKNKFFHWMRNIRDWCISRQLWWGHRIPIWHCADCNEMTPASSSRVDIVDGRAAIASVPAMCAQCGSRNIAQDTDVLDTWFSSALWPFSMLGWPDNTEDLKSFYPTSLLISGYDILFFWDARMMMMGLHLLRDIRPRAEDRIPFRALYLHSLVRDPEGLKMSKTRGNVVDPLEVIERHGTDALRFTLAIMAAPGTDIALSEERILSYRAFANKIWNAARFLFFNLEKAASRGLTLAELASPAARARAPYPTDGQVALVDRWIFSRLAQTIETVNLALQEFRFHEAAHEVYHFFWGDFCDWYIEWVKPQLASENREAAAAAWKNIFAVFDAALRLLHPFMPFLTEELWHRLPQPDGAQSIARDRFPEPQTGWKNEEVEQDVKLLQEVITAARNIRAELKVDQKKKVAARLATSSRAVESLLRAHMEPVVRLAGLSELTLFSGKLDAASGVVRSTSDFDLSIQVEQTVDSRAEAIRIRKEVERLAKDIASKQSRLSDESFRSKAPEKVVRDMENTLRERTAARDKLLAQLQRLEGESSTPA